MSNQDNVLIQKIRNKGITHAIRQKLENDGHIAKGSNLSSSVWEQIIQLVSEDEQAKTQYTGESEFIAGSTPEAMASWKNNFKISYDTSKSPTENVITFTLALWNKIVELVRGETQQDDAPESSPPTQPEPSQDDATPPPQQEPLPPENDIGPQYVPETTQPVPDGAKVQLRNIVNVYSNTKGNKEMVITTTDDNGNKVYHQGVTDDKGSTVMGSRLIADTRGLRQNEYYAVDNSIPDGAEVDRKPIDGTEDMLNYEIKEEDGKTHRYSMVLDDVTNKYKKGDELFAIQTYSNGNFRNTNKFVSETELNKKIKIIIPDATVQSLKSQGIETHLATDGSIVFTKAGKRITPEVLNSKNNTQESPIIDPQNDKGYDTKTTPESTPTPDPVVTPTPAPVAPPTPDNTPKPSPKGGMTDEEVEAYIQRDDNYQQRKAYMEQIDATMKQMEEKYNVTRGDFHSKLNIVRTPDYSKYFEMEAFMNFYNLDDFKNTLKNWEDTPKDADVSKNFYRRNNVTWTGVRKETLPDGTKVYNTEQGYYNLYFDGGPGEKMSEEELTKHGWTNE